MRVGIYARVSTKGQDPTMQLLDLRKLAEARGWTVAGEYIDHGISGAKDRRPALDRLMADARRRDLDVVACWRFDRMARSSRHLIGMLEEFMALGISFVSHQEAMDTTTPAGKVLFAVVAAFGEFERAVLGERCRAGIQRAKAMGVRLGRPPLDVSPERVSQEYARAGSLRAVAKTLRISAASAQRLLKRSQACAAAGA